MQNLLAPIDEEETTSMRELVAQIDSYVELVDVEVSSNPCTSDQLDEDIQLQPFITSQQPPGTTTETQPTEPTAWLPNWISFIYFHFPVI